MARKISKRNLIIFASIGAVLLAVLIIVLVNALAPRGADPYRQDTAIENSQENTNTPEQIEEDTPAVTETRPTEDEDAAIDPATVATIDIQPLSLTVSYVRGIGGFEYSIQRTANGTQYVEFTSPQLVGTKCTDDKGAFASILQNPDSNESSTLSKTQTVDGTRYGLSLADDTCTSDAALLKQYQASFSDAFSLLKKTS